MKPTALIALFVASFTFCSQGFTANSCSQVFEEKDQAVLVIEQATELINRFDSIKADVSQSTLKVDMNDHLYSLVVLSNKLLDFSIQNIVEINVMPLPENVLAAKSQVVDVMMSRLQQSFQISDEIIQPIVMGRVEAIIEELKANYFAEQERRAVGFNRDDLAINFFADPENQQPIGFNTFPRSREQDEQIETVNLESRVENDNEIETEALRLAQFPQTEAEVESLQVGFVEFETTESDRERGQAVGFVPVPPDKEAPTSENIDKMLFNLESGVFDLMKAEG